jgi:PAS domain S-box-containing protein
MLPTPAATHAAPPSESAAEGWLPGMAAGGEMGERIRRHDWAATAMGPLQDWPAALRVALDICLQSSFPTAIYWGPEMRLLYNDAWAPIPAERHPWALGRPAQEVWEDIWPVIAPQFDRVMRQGEGVSTFDQMLPMRRGGRVRETYWNYSVTPIRGGDGRILGIFNQGNETTGKVLAERRQAFLLHLADRLRGLAEPGAVIAAAQEEVGRHLGASRVGYAELDFATERFTTGANWSDGSVAADLGTHDLSPFGDAILAPLLRGGTLVVEDTEADPRCTAESRAAFAAMGTRATISAALLEAGRMRATLFVHAREPRAWTEAEVALVEEVAQRTRAAVERSRAEVAVRESEARFRNLADHAPLMMWVTEPGGRCTYLNRLWYEFTGQTEEEALGFGWLDAVHPDDRVRAGAAFLRADGQRMPFRLEYRLRRADGAYRWAIDAAAPRFGPQGEFLGYVGSVFDISDRHEVEEALRASEARFRGIFDSDLTGFIVFDANADTVLAANDCLLRLTGHRRDPRLAWDWRAATPPERLPERDAAVAQARARGWWDPFVTELLRRDGSRFPARLASAPLQGEPGRVVVSVADISEEVATQAALSANRERLSLGLAAGRMVTWEYDIATGTVIRSENAEEVLGEGAMLETFLARIPQAEADADQARLRDAVEGRAAAYESEYRYRHPDGRWLWLHNKGRVQHDAEGRAVRVNGVAIDITARKAMEQVLSAREAELRRLNARLEERVREEVAARAEAQSRLAHAQRMEALGQLAGGIAHDFNNVLQAIQGGARLLRQAPGDAARVLRLSGMMSEAAGRGAAVTRRLLAFSRRADLRAEAIDAAELLAGLREVLAHTLGGGIGVQVAAPPGLPPLLADKGQLETVLVNLAANARDAMAGQGTIGLRAALAGDGAALPPGLRPGRYLRLSIADTGTGMSAEVLARASEPFFTTKPVGKGTGLGLAMARGFAEQSGGTLWIDSEAGRGTTVSLWLPTMDRPAAQRPSALPATPAAASDERGRVLLVDDDAIVRRITAEVLADAGFVVLVAESGAQALRLLDEGAAIDVLVSDLSMPGMDGVSLIRAAQRSRPALPAILLTGFATDIAELAVSGAVSGSFSLLRKPVDANTLADRVAVMLQARG